MTRREADIVAGTLTGAVGAMAMSGLRTVTTHLGALRRTPPERVFDAAAPEASGSDRAVAQELAHWAFGAGGGAAFGALPARATRSPAAGVVYGLSVWAFFELVLQPMLGHAGRHRRPVPERLALIADHALYGLVLWAGKDRR